MYQVYVIGWRRSLTELQSLLNKNGGYISLSAIFRWSTKERRMVETTDKTMVICPEATINNLKTDTTFNGQINDYDWSGFPSPTFGETYNLHISGIPNEFSHEEAVDLVHNYLRNLLRPDQYQVQFGLRSRTTGQINGHGDIFFQEGISHDIIKLCKLCLHNKPIIVKGQTKIIRCVWFMNQPVRRVKERSSSINVSAIFPFLPSSS